MFKAIVTKQIHGCFAAVSSLDVYVERELTLPFVPTQGLRIVEGEWESGELVEIVWDANKFVFACYTNEDKELYHAGLHREPARPIEEIVKEYTDAGWTARKR